MQWIKSKIQYTQSKIPTSEAPSFGICGLNGW